MLCSVVLLNIMEFFKGFFSLPLTNPVLILSIMLLIILHLNLLQHIL